jgi:hypothetical protein
MLIRHGSPVMLTSLTDHLNNQIHHCVIIQFRGSLRSNVVQQRYQSTEDQQRTRLALNLSLHKYSGKCPAEYEAHL